VDRQFHGLAETRGGIAKGGRRMRKVVVLTVIAVLAVVVLTAATPTSTSAAGPISYYGVHPGDTMFGIANRHGVTPWALARANGVWNPGHIYSGQMLYIPCAGCWYPRYPQPVQYRMPYQPWQYRVPYQQPWQFRFPYPQPWQYWGPVQYHYPMPGPINQCTYQVHYGETLSSIAYRHGLSTLAFAQLNGISNLNWIYAGQWLRVPGCRY
jgi:LysM repeat protein